MQACGLLDFQDAQQGHPSYDLVSLIEDARRDVAPAVHAACLDRYLGETGLDAKDFAAGFALMAAQRHARIIGLFVRLLERDGKPEYLPHLPRVWRMFERSLRHDALQPLRAWVDRLLPPDVAAYWSHMIDTAMILAAGRGERMRPLTDHDAQAADPRRRLADARAHAGAPDGARRRQHRGQRPSSRPSRSSTICDGRAQIIVEDRLLETGGSVKNALPLLGDGPFFVLNGDGLWRDGPQSRC